MRPTLFSTCCLALSLSLSACMAGDDSADEEGLGAEGAEALGQAPKDAKFSALWGKRGERWSPKSRLPDFSYAGYQGGDARIPEGQKRTIDVRDYGAKPNDGKNDGPAIERAIREAPKGAVVFLPKGRYDLSNPIRIERSHVVLRGEGSGTILKVSRGLRNVAGYSSKEVSYSGGFIEVLGERPGGDLAKVTGATPRGEHWLEVSSTKELHPGDVVALRYDVDDEFLSHVYAGQHRLEKTSEISDDFDMPVVIDKVGDGKVRLVQPLRLDVRNRWNPKLVGYHALREVGIEKLSFRFDRKGYGGHHEEDGFNGVHMNNVVNGWVRDVTFRDADNGVKFERCKWMTAEGLRFRGGTGHHGVSVARSADVLVQDVHFGTEFWHELTVVYGTHGAVFRAVSAAKGVEMHLDHHGEFPFENLFTNFKGVSKYSWMSGGGDPKKGPHAGARGTFWNLDGLAPPNRYDDVDGDPQGETENAPWRALQTTLVGNTSAKSTKSDKGLWVEDLPRLWPRDLYRAQLEQRRHDEK